MSYRNYCDYCDYRNYRNYSLLHIRLIFDVCWQLSIITNVTGSVGLKGPVGLKLRGSVLTVMEKTISMHLRWETTMPRPMYMGYVFT